MINNGNSAFWREVLDFVPNLTLLFRIEEDESAHLIFVNQEIQNQLLYRPQDYVLEGESDTPVKKDLDRLIDKIADLSYKTQREEDIYCDLHDRHGSSHIYSFDFRIFQTRVGKTSLILVTLNPAGDIERKAASDSEKPVKRAIEEPVWQSEVMRAILDKIPEYRLQGSSLLIRGEKGTGRRTLARYMAKHLSTREDEIFMVELDRSEEKQRQQLFGEESRTNPLLGGSYAGWLQMPVMCVVISDLAELTERNIQMLADHIRQRTERKFRTRLIAISEAALEEIVDRLGSLYYELNFYPILMPGLKHRKEDIRIITRNWLTRASEILDIGSLTIADKEYIRLEEYDWPGNFPEFFRVLRHSLLASDDGVVHFRMKSVTAGSDAAARTGREGSELLPYDEMNRRYLKKVLEVTEGKIYGKEGAAFLLGLKPTTLQSKLKKLKVK